MEWMQLAPKALWNLVKSELKSYWDWDLTTDSIDATVEKYQVQKVSILRSFCQRAGIQVSVI